MPSVSLIYSGEFLIASQLPAGKRITARVHNVTVETLGLGADQTQKLALELTAPDGRPWPRKVILNKTNATIIANAFGDEAGNWTGNAIEIWQEPTQFQGRVVPGVRVAPVHQKPPAPTKPQASGPSWDHAKSLPPTGSGGNGDGAGIPEQSLSDALDDEVPF